MMQEPVEGKETCINLLRRVKKISFLAAKRSHRSFLPQQFQTLNKNISTMTSTKRDLGKKPDDDSTADHKRSVFEQLGCQKSKKSQKQLAFSFGSSNKINFPGDSSCGEILFVCSACGGKNQHKDEMVLASKNLLKELREETAKMRKDQRKMKKEIEIFFSRFLKENFQLIEQNISKEVEKRIDEIMRGKRISPLAGENRSKLNERRDNIQPNYSKSDGKIPCYPEGCKYQTEKIQATKPKNTNSKTNISQREMLSLTQDSQQVHSKNIQSPPKFGYKISDPTLRLHSAGGKDKKEGENRKNESPQVFLNRMKSLDSLKERISKLKKEIMQKKK